PTWALWTLLWRLHIESTDTARFALFGTAGMYFPGIAALIVRYFDRDLHGTTLGRLGIERYYVWPGYSFRHSSRQRLQLISLPAVLGSIGHFSSYIQFTSIVRRAGSFWVPSSPGSASLIDYR
ncbi:MAG TPA: hypothetical protein VMA09_14695, partial [Candidatus Binataceae bacterium]|nr:hypothetical protein [Candidatus Binataceae bacterium]